MKLKKLVILVLALTFPFTLAGREKVLTAKINEIKTEVTHVIRRAVDQELEDTEDPNEIFSRALDGYKEEFPSYLDITALNVQDKEAIELPDFDIDYIVPEFYDIMHDYQVKLEASLSEEDLEYYETLREYDYNFDRYVSLNEVKFSVLDPKLKYVHKIQPVNPTIPITPMNPGIGTNPGGGTSTISAASGTMEIINILKSIGLVEKIISAFTSCISLMTTALSTSWIPFIGWKISVPLVIAALMAMAAIIILNWIDFKSVMNDIKIWFLEQFAKFKSFIESFFSDAAAKGNESTVSSRTEIDGKTFEFTEVRTLDIDAMAAIATQCRRKKDALLIKHSNANVMQISLTEPVDVDFCIRNKTHVNGYSSYTWYQNTARKLILEAGSGYTTTAPEIHLYNKNKPNDNNPKLAFKHFHNYDSLGNIIRKPNAIFKTHSFFGLLYCTEKDDGEGTVHPNSPKN